MEFLIFIGGVLTGCIITLIFKKYGKTYGVIKVDHRIQACKLYVTSKDLLEHSTKHAIFEIDHNADLSREEQVL